MSERKDKIIAVIGILSIGISAFLVGYSLGYYEGEKDTVEKRIAELKEFNEQLDTISSQINNNNVWWNTSWKSRINLSSGLKSYLYYSSNCTEEQINKFIEGDYGFYDDSSGCSMRIIIEKEK